MSLSSIGANISAGASKLFSGAKGAMIEEGLVKKAKNSATRKVLDEETAQGLKLGELGGDKVKKEYDSTLKSVGSHAPTRKENIDINGKKTSTMTVRDRASSIAATNKYEGRIAGDITEKEQFDQGSKYVDKKVRNKMPGKVLGGYYAKPFTDGRIGTGIARGAVTAGAIGGTGYAVTQLTDNYREDYKKNNHSKDY